MKNKISDEGINVEKALEQFPYFETWSRKTIVDCCRLSKIKVFPPNDVILGSEEQESAGVHFIMEGTCKLIEHLSLVQKRTSNGRIKYSIFRDKNVNLEISAADEPKYSSLLFNMGNTTELETIENLQVKINDNFVLFERNQTEGVKKESNEPDIAYDKTQNISFTEKDATESKNKTNDKVAKKEKSEVEGTKKFAQFYRRMLPYISAKSNILRQKSSKVESHFLQIGLIHKGCCLGLGENLRNRYLVSITKVTCLVIPLQFLLQHNPNNIWNRIKQFLNDYLPKEEKILSEFVMNKKWNECKRNLVASKGGKSSTAISDVPISIRLNDANMTLELFKFIFFQSYIGR